MNAEKTFTGLDRSLTGKELAEKLKVHPATIRLWRSEGLPHTKLNTRLFRYNLEEVIQWSEQRNK